MRPKADINANDSSVGGYERIDINKELSFINKDNINFCLYFHAKELRVHYTTFTHNFDRKISTIKRYVRSLKGDRKQAFFIREMKKTVHIYDRKQRCISWINFNDSLHRTWISMYLLSTDNSYVDEMLHNEVLSQDLVFYFLCDFNEWRSKEFIDIFKEMKEAWSNCYVKRHSLSIESNNEKQLDWIFDYLLKKGLIFSHEDFPLPINKKTKFEYIYSLLSLIQCGIIDPNESLMCKEDEPYTKKESDNEDAGSEVLTTEKFLDNLNKAWKTHLRRSAKEQPPIYKLLSKKTAKRLESLCKKNNQTPEKMIEFLMDTFE